MGTITHLKLNQQALNTNSSLTTSKPKVSFQPVHEWLSAMSKYKKQRLYSFLVVHLNIDRVIKNDEKYFWSIKKMVDDRFDTKMPMEFFQEYDFSL